MLLGHNPNNPNTRMHCWDAAWVLGAAWVLMLLGAGCSFGTACFTAGMLLGCWVLLGNCLGAA
eukprot:11166886-Lingulodinium_polyedra.AAC.1